MFYSKRQEEILQLLEKEKSISVQKLAKLLFVSESSVRRDLSALEEMGKIHRTFGGAVLMESPEKEVSLMFRRSQNMGQKQLIAQKAVAYVRDGMMIFLDASSTVAQLIPLLKGFRDLTVVTNSPQASLMLAELKIRNYSTGGKMLNNSLAYVGVEAARALENLRADMVFFSCRGMSEDGLITDSMEEEAEIRRVMLKHAKKKIFLCDKSKIGRSYSYVLCRAEDVDQIITEDT